MDKELVAVAQKCLSSAYDGSLTFPSIVGRLVTAGFESYGVDYRSAKATYFLPNGESVELALPKSDGGVAAEFNPAVVERAVREAQANAPGYTYAGFCAKVKAAGCAGYMVSFLGRRVVYFGRTGETHVEHFPKN
ncbi:MAG TPA: hypothetical protein VFQ35_04860 [Polyangiaceae bacterium]|nr:hypothetical protein [Polyangiaceae bacterium]